MKNLPKGWEIKKLGEICKIVNGFAFKSSDFKDFGIPIVKIANVGYSEFKTKDQQYVDESFLKVNTNVIINPGDILFALTRPITNDTTKVCKFPNTYSVALLNQRVCSIREFNREIESEYVYWYFQSIDFKNYIKTKFSETLQPNLSPKDLSLTLIPLPPLETQQRIVAKIEELFSELDKGVEELKKTQEQLKTYRQSVLKWAFEGRFTNENVKDGVLPEGWEWKRLGSIFNFIGGGTPSKNESSFWNGNIPWASIKDIKGSYLTQTSDYITEEGLKNSTTNLALNGELIVATRINPGRPIITKIDTTINQDLKIARSKVALDIKFGYYYFLSCENEILKKSSGTTVLGIRLEILNDLEIIYPPIEEQHQIVQEIESRLSVADKLQEQIKTSLQQAEALRQSILKKAFEGELVR